MTSPADDRYVVPITIQLDPRDLLRVSLPAGYDHENDEVIMGESLAADLIARAATVLAEAARKEIAEAAGKAAQEQVAREVGEIVARTLKEGVVIGDGYSKTVVKPLRELIKDEVDAWLTKGRADRFDSKGSPLQELLKKEVDAAMTADLRQSIAEAKATAQAAVKAKASEIVAAAVVR